MRAAAREVGHLRHHLLHEGGREHLDLGWGTRPLRLHDLDLLGHVQRIVGADLGAEAVLERGDDAPPRGVVLGVGARHHQQVEGQPDPVAADLDVLLLHDVEQPDLDPLRQVRQLVDGEDAPVAARHQAVVDGELVGQVASLRDPDRVHLTDQVSDRDVWRRELLASRSRSRHRAPRPGPGSAGRWGRRGGR